MGDFEGGGNFTPSEVWDPFLGRNVYLEGGMSAAQYMVDNAAHYQNYTGAVAHMGNTPIHASTYTGAREAEPAADYRQSYERSRINPYDSDPYNAKLTDVANTARVLPGARPDTGFTPDLGAINLLNYMPYAWTDTNQRQPDDVERKLADLAAQRNIPFATLKSLTWDKGKNPADVISGRGYHYGGDPSAEEQQMTQAFLAGQPTDINRLARSRGERIEVNQPSAMQDFGNKIWGPAVISGVGAIATGGIGGAFGPLAGAGTGAGFGALSSGAMTRWDNPAAIVAGTAGGALGGYGAGAGAQFLGAGPMLTGAASGAGAGFGNSFGRGAAAGEIDPGDILRNTAIGGATGGAAAGTGVPSSVFAPPASIMADSLDPRRRNPYF